MENTRERTEGRGSADRATVGRDTADRGAAGRDTADRATAGRDMAERGTADRDTADRGTAYKGTADRRPAGEETVGRKEGMDRCREIERSVIKKFRKEIWRPFVKALNEYDMIKEGDNIAVCISGGKDSMLLAKCMQEILRHGKMEFGLHFLVMDPGYNPENRRMIEENAKIMGIPITVFETDIFDVVVDVDQSPCYLCARMRRGHLYANARKLGCNKIALGHHFDDVIETILMSMLYGAQVNTMMPKLHSTNFEGMELIRPLYLVKEADIQAWRDFNGLRFLQCACRFTEAISREEEAHMSKRQEMKELIAKFRTINPHIETNIFKSVENVNLDACIGYVKGKERHNFLEEY